MTVASVATRRPARRHPARIPLVWLLGAFTFTLAAMAVALALGPVSVPITQVAQALADNLPWVEVDHGLRGPLAAVVTEIRLPRVVLAAMVGAVLACAGGGYQATFRNPLADPYLLGVAAGAGFGVTIALTDTGGVLGSASVLATIAAFAGALIAVGLTYVLGLDADRTRSTASLILAGVAVAALFSALQALLLQRDDEAIRDVYSWLLGPVQRRRLGPGAAAGAVRRRVDRRHRRGRPPPRRARRSATTKPSPSASTLSPCVDS